MVDEAGRGGDRFDRLGAGDLVNLAVEAPDTPMHLGVLAVLDGRPLLDDAGRLRLAEIRRTIAGRLREVPQLLRIVHRAGPLAGPPVWIDDPAFDIGRHVHQVRLPAGHDGEQPGDGASPGDGEPPVEGALLRLAERLMTPPLPRDRPLWRIWFITGTPGGNVAVVVALHHAVADGLAAVRLVTRLLDAPAVGDDDGPPVTGPATGERAGRRTVPRWRDLAGDNLRRYRTAWSRTAPGPRHDPVTVDERPTGRTDGHPAERRPARPSGTRPARLLRTLGGAWRMLATTSGAPRTSLTGPVGPRRRLAVLRLDLAEVKAVAHAYAGKVNDVVLALAAGGLRALLLARGEPVDGVALRAAVAVSLRPAAGAEAGNRTGGIVVRLPLDLPGPADRLRRIGAGSAAAKRGQLVTGGQGLLLWAARLGLLRWFARHQRMTNLVESNVTGPAAPIRVLGAPVLDLVPIGNLAGNLAVSFLAMSYAGGLTIAVRADADRYPDLPVLMAAMRGEWEDLRGTTPPPR